MDQQCVISNPEINPYIYTQLFEEKKSQDHSQGESGLSSTDTAGTAEYIK